MIDGRFDPALTALYAEEVPKMEDIPSALALTAVSVISVAVAALLCWTLS